MGVRFDRLSCSEGTGSFSAGGQKLVEGFPASVVVSLDGDVLRISESIASNQSRTPSLPPVGPILYDHSCHDDVEQAAGLGAR
jgi:hypothetical protein